MPCDWNRWLASICPKPGSWGGGCRCTLRGQACQDRALEWAGGDAMTNAQELSDASRQAQAELLRRQLQSALTYHQAGDLAQAQTLYDEILASDPNHFDALQLSGMIAYDSQRLQEAEIFLLKALCVRADIASVYSNYGLVLHGFQRFADALVVYDQALELDPKLSVTYMNRGVALANLGRHDEAITSYDRAILINPDYAEACSNQGNALRDIGRFLEAAASFDKAITMKPDYADAYNNRGNALCDLKQFEKALGDYDRSIWISPSQANAHNNRGNALRDLKRFQDALTSFDKAISISPDYADAHKNLGNALYDMQRFQDALNSYDKAIALAPDHVEGHTYRSSALHRLKRFAEALASCDRAISLKPSHAEAYNKRGDLLQDLALFSEALENFERAISLKPHDAEGFSNRSNALREMKRFEEALASCDQAISLKPTYAEAYSNRGFTLYEMERFEDALGSCDQAISLKADLVEAYLNRGKILQELKRFDEAVACLHEASSIDPAHPETYNNLSHLLLLQGHFADGLAFYEWRKKSAEPKGARTFNKPLWTGEADLSNKRILIHWEQGLGDTIQFCRYIRLLGEKGARVLFAPQKALRGLLRSLAGDCGIVDENDPSLAFDFHCPLLSLPLAFKTTLSTIPARTAYLEAERDRMEKWAAALGAHGLKIGICWQGSTGRIDSGRSFSVGAFEALSQIPGLRLISLHKGVGEAQLQDLPPGLRVETLGADFDAGPDAFLDTAAVMKCCDLVITSDTSVAHLAGALGVKTWVALKHVPDWRWFMERSDSPWYPTMRLFRQQSHGDWNGVFQNIRTALLAESARAQT